MMDTLRTWLYGVFCAALLLTLSQGLLPKGKLRQLASLAGALLLLLVMLRPLGVGRDWDWDWAPAAFQAAVSARQEAFNSPRQAQLAAIIAEEAEAYIWKKGAACGLKAVEVEVREEGGVLLPWSARLDGPCDEDLSRALAEELGIPRERQYYEGD